MLTSIKTNMADTTQGQPSRRKRNANTSHTAEVFRDALKVKRLRKKATILGTEEKPVVGQTPDQLVADHEWASLIHNFEHEAEAHAGDAEDELWERLGSTRWLKDTEEGLDPV